MKVLFLFCAQNNYVEIKDYLLLFPHCNTEFLYIVIVKFPLKIVHPFSTVWKVMEVFYPRVVRTPYTHTITSLCDNQACLLYSVQGNCVHCCPLQRHMSCERTISFTLSKTRSRYLFS